MARTGQPAARQLAAVERATRVLDVLAAGDGELGTNEIARLCDVNASTVSRILATLVASGYVEHVPASGRYRLGVRLVQLGQAVLARLDMRGLARPLLEALVEETGETATLSLPAEGDAVTADYVSGRGSVISVARVGRPSIPHATAVGKVMLAFGPQRADGAGTHDGGPLQRLTPATIVDPDALAAELGSVRARGYAVAAGEREPDLNAVAAPVLDTRGALCAIVGLQGPASRFGREAMDAAAPAVVATARRLSRALGA
jgi:IclR family acetate operon transcriptional repressor